MDDQTTLMMKQMKHISSFEHSDNTRKLMKQMLQLFKIYIQRPWSGSKSMHNVGDTSYSMILDVIQQDEGQLMSLLLENFIRLMGTGVEQEAVTGNWVDRSDEKVKSRRLFWKQEKYIDACQALYGGINEYVTNMVSQYQQQHANIDEKYEPNWTRFRVDINAELFKDVLDTQSLMAQKCREIHLYNNNGMNFRMDKYIAMMLKFMLISLFLVIINSVNFEFKQQKEKAIQYEPHIKDVFYPKQSESSVFSPRFKFYENVNFGNYSSFFDHKTVSLDNKEILPCSNKVLALKYNNYESGQFDYQSEWIEYNEPFYALPPEPVQSVCKPLNTDKALVPIFKTLCDYSVSTDQSLWTNLSANNHFYDLWMNKQCIDMVKNVIDNDLDHSLFITNYFHSSYDPKQIKISKGARRLIDDPNAGGNSELSESFSFEILKECFDAKLLKTEMEIKYQYKNCKITDYLASINEKQIGVSVTRAFKYKGEFNEKDALKLLNKKIYGVNESSKNVTEQDSFSRQILHIWATEDNLRNPKEKDVLYQVFKRLLLSNPKFINNTIFIVTVASPDCWWIFRQNAMLGTKSSKKKKGKKKKKKKRNFNKKSNDNPMNI